MSISLSKRLLTNIMIVLAVLSNTVLPAQTQAVLAASAGPALTVNAAASQHAISPNIYGLNFAKETFASEIGLPLRRWGGNATTRYNWQNGDLNSAQDWYYENMTNSNAYSGATETHTQWVDQNVRTSTQSLITIPLVGYVAKDSSSCGFSISKYGAQQDHDVWRTDCGNGIKTNGSNLTGNAATDTSVASTPAFMQSWVASLVSKYGTAANGGVKFYAMDNEPDLWGSTHRDVHPAMQSYDELLSKTVAYATAVKTADPSAQVLAFSSYGWTGYWYSEYDADAAAKNGYTSFPDYQSHGNLYQVPWFLTQMHNQETTGGTRLLDYLDLHYYPSGGNALATAGDANLQALRLRSTRSLWDPTYVDESWIGGSDQPVDWRTVRLIPRMKAWVNSYYPNTKLAITEYNFGGLESINGALAQADVLGIFGREGLDMANLWNYPNTSDGLGYDHFETEPGAYAFRMYRNYDGSGGRFGDISLSASSTDQSKLAVYAARRSSDGALTMMVINKTSGDLTSALGLSNFQPASAARVYTYSSANLSAIVRQADQAVTAGGFSATFPANSITLVVIPLASVPQLGGCAMFPANNIWNARVDSLPVHSLSDQWLTNIGKATGFHADFGSGTWDGGPIGIPYNLAGASTPKYTVTFYYPDESDAGPYPIGASPNIEWGSDHHLLTVDSSTCKLYEIYDASTSAGAWSGGSGAVWDLASNALRHDGWTSADAAGLPILPGLVRYDEVASGHINHAIRFTVSSTNGYIWPARHLTSNNSGAPQIPPMGARFRLKSSFNMAAYPADTQVILQAMKTYGIILADNGSNWYISGVPDERWNNTNLHTLGNLKGSDFEAVDDSGLMMDVNSGAAWTPAYTISGSAGVGSATLTYSDGQARSATADASGNYSLGVSANWSGTVTVSKTGYTFTPTSKTYSNVITNQSAQNYTATPPDVTPPTVLSSVRASTNPSTAATVNFTVTFSEAVTGVDTTDFAITQSGLTGTSVTNVSGSGASYTITANTGSGNNGTLRLDLVDNDSVKDLAGNPLGGTGTGNGSFTSGETYTILKNVLGAGTYDDPNSGITYTGSWSPNSSSGPYLGTIHTTSSIGDSAAVNFSGQQIKVIYTGAPTTGVLDVYVDSTKVASINQYSANWDQQKVWTSDLFAAGTHSLRLVYASGGSFADLDGLQVITTPALLASGVNDDTAANLNYEGRWYTLTGVTGPASGSLHYSSAPGDDLQGSFTGQQFRLTYLASPSSGLADLYIDGVKIATINQHSDNWDWQTTWTSGLLSAGTHSFRMVYASGGSLVSLDALEVVSSPVILGTNSYDDGNAGLNYQGRWYTLSSVTGPSLGTLHYMNYQNGTATLLFSGRQIRLTYLAAPIAGVMDVYVDNVKVTSLNQHSDTWDWQRVWSSDLYASGTHSLRLVNANGVMTNVDGVEILGSPLILGTNVYDDLAAGLNYDGNWQKVSAVSGAYNNTFQYSNGIGENLEVPFNGRQIKLTYLTSPTFGTADVYIDGVKVTTLDQSSTGWVYGVTWTSAVLSAGDHSLRLVHAGGVVVAIDAVQVIP